MMKKSKGDGSNVLRAAVLVLFLLLSGRSVHAPTTTLNPSADAWAPAPLLAGDILAYQGGGDPLVVETGNGGPWSGGLPHWTRVLFRNGDYIETGVGPWSVPRCNEQAEATAQADLARLGLGAHDVCMAVGRVPMAWLHTAWAAMEDAPVPTAPGVCSDCGSHTFRVFRENGDATLDAELEGRGHLLQGPAEAPDDLLSITLSTLEALP